MKKVKCNTCNGTGKVKRYPYYATIMPEMETMTCEHCKGNGYIIKVRKDIVVQVE